MAPSWILRGRGVASGLGRTASNIRKEPSSHVLIVVTSIPLSLTFFFLSSFVHTILASTPSDSFQAASYTINQLLHLLDWSKLLHRIAFLDKDIYIYQPLPHHSDFDRFRSFLCLVCRSESIRPSCSKISSIQTCSLQVLEAHWESETSALRPVCQLYQLKYTVS